MLNARFSSPPMLSHGSERSDLLGLKVEGGLQPRPPLHLQGQCSFCSITLYLVEKLLSGNKFGSGEKEMMGGEKEEAEILQVTAEDRVNKEMGWLGHQGPQLDGAGTSPPHSVRPQAKGCQCSSVKTPGEPEIKYSSSPAQAALLPLTANILL